ncbi:MAG: hypothetical protein LDLANPLL_02205 [Turneriella sp.]|nr:hypothetical protein [Turneriella sp.]
MILRNSLLFITTLAALSVSPRNARMPYQSTLPEALQNVTRDLENLWEEDACETVTVKKKGYPLTSIACQGNYTKAMRTKFIDILLKNFFTVKRETYKLRPQNGMYLYKTRYGNETVYFKLFVRDALDLWPKNPVQGKQIALYIQNVRTNNDLVKWRTLGVPITFGITVGRGDSKALIEQLSSYGDEIWLAIPLEDESIEIADGRLLTISEALDADKLAEYLESLEITEGVVGLSPLYCSRFCKNVPALRSLFNAINNLNEKRNLIILDTTSGSKDAIAPFYKTGRIMNFRAFRARTFVGNENGACASVQNFVSEKEVNATRIMSVDASDEKAYECLNKIARNKSTGVDFVKISSLSQTNRLR